MNRNRSNSILPILSPGILAALLGSRAETERVGQPASRSSGPAYGRFTKKGGVHRVKPTWKPAKAWNDGLTPAQRRSASTKKRKAINEARRAQRKAGYRG